MPRQARRIAGSGIYHVMLRGVNRDAIFLEDQDYERFLHALSQAKELSGCVVLAYCLMPNHVHLVLRESGEPIGAVVKRLGVRYAGWFNRKYGRVGHLFQDRFRSQPVEDDAYLVTLLRYVWNNPVEAGLAARPEEYRWGSRSLSGDQPALVDEAMLAELLPTPGPTDLDALSLVCLDADTRLGRPKRYSAREAADLLRRMCGATSPEDFRRLATATQRRAIGELRTRSVPYAQIAIITGLSTTSVKRAQVGVQLAATPRVA